MEVKGIVTIGLEHIHPHPDNPRKDLGDLTELAESIKKNGIMQNLTVIPKEGEPGEYITIIGHRRSAAAKLAGVTEAPCRVVEGMTDKEQMSTMLEENMQRNDLTIWEQAQGFQMMLDLGETEDTIAEKTGFSKKNNQTPLEYRKTGFQDADGERETGRLPAVAYGFVRAGKDQGRKDQGQDFEGFHRFERFGKKSNQRSEGAETPGKHEVVRGNDEETGIKESSEGSGQ